MTPAQLEAYLAVCAADTECRCPLAQRYEDLWINPGKGYVIGKEIAAAAITDHLHTRLGWQNGSASAEYGSVPQRWTCIDWGVNCGEPVIRNTDKLTAMLAAHIVRLDLPRELITKMEES